MTNQVLSTYFELHRRYYRSVNLERDLNKADAVQGYVPTERSAEALRRILSAIGDPDAHRAWTLTGVYGTGKSAFAHYFAALCAPEGSPVAEAAWAIADQVFPAGSPVMEAMEAIPAAGFLRAVATAQREPLSWTIVRALSRGFDSFWQKQRKPSFWMDLNEWRFQAESGDCQVTDQQVLKLLREIVQTAETDVLLIVDELGKNLEYAAYHQGIQDLYLLQQIAELELAGDHQIHLLGILHQSFAGYSDRLSTLEQSEWTKIHGRFTDIVLTESPSQMTRLIGQAIVRSKADPVLHRVHSQAESWLEALQAVLSEYEISARVLAEAYPLHPLTALVLPMLCVRYAQNDRSLFTFLTSDEPYAFPQFLKSATIQGDQIPTLKLHQLYDYFVESVTGIASRLNLQRWVEVQGLIQDAKDQSQDVLQALKTIGVLNLVTSTGKFCATPELVALALCDSPTDQKERKRWQKAIQQLKQKSLITHRKTHDELRIWQGSDFDIEAAIQAQIEQIHSPLADLLKAIHPLKPLVAQRHYTTSGTLRYFEQQYIDERVDLKTLTGSAASDGLIAYWLDKTAPVSIPACTADGKPLVIVMAKNLELLRVRGEDFLALKKIWQDAPELQTDGVAKREVRQRLVAAEQLLNETVALVFNWSTQQNSCWIAGELVDISSSRGFQSALSDLCDRTYHKGIVLDNELINRRELTSQGAKARRELIEAMLKNADKARLGLEGYGPEVAIYYSVLAEAGIHRQVGQSDGEEWGFQPPPETAGIWTGWQAIEAFCLEAKDQMQSLDLLYRRLEAPPYGVKQGVIPVLLAAVLAYRVDEVSVYRDGSFIPVLSSEQFELLVKDPARYGVKSVEVAGLRAQVFRELESILRTGRAKPSQVRNSTLLSVVKPLFQFVRRLPAYTLKTKRLSPSAQAVLQTLLQAQEPDVLLFQALPVACGLPPITTEQTEDGARAKQLRKQLVQALQEIQNAYDTLLGDCQRLLHSAFGVRDQERLREDLRVRSGYLSESCIDPLLRRFALAAAEQTTSDRDWIEALVMIVADRPAESWSDEDATAFELKLSDLARRFRNLEALRTEVAASGQGFEVRRVTITCADGQELHRMVWLDHDKRERVEALVEDLLGQLNLYDDAQLQQAIAARLAERVLGAASSAAGQKMSKLEAKRNHDKAKGKTSQTNSRTLRRQG